MEWNCLEATACCSFCYGSEAEVIQTNIMQSANTTVIELKLLEWT